MPKYEVWLEGYMEVEASTEEEAMDVAVGKLNSGAVVRINAPRWPEPVRVVKVEGG